MVQSKAPPTRLASGRRAQRRARRRDAGLEPAGRRPRRPGLPHRAVPARRPGDLERQLVRRPLHPHLQRPLPAAGLAARPALVGTVAVVASSYFFDRLVRDRWGEEARWATLWFAAGVVTLLADGQLTFALGVAFGLAALRCLQLRRAAAGARRGRGLRALQPGRRRLPRRRVCVGALRAAAAASTGSRSGSPRVALGLTARPQPRLPRAGQFPFAFSSYIAIPLWCGAALYVTRGLGGEERQLRRVLIAYLLAATVILLVAERDGRQRGAPRRPLRRPGAGRGGAGPPARASRSGSCVLVHGRRPLLAADRERQPDRPQRRRPLDHRGLLRPRRQLAARPRRRRRAGRGAADREPLGVGLPGARTSSSPAAGCASSTPPATTSSTATRASSPTAPTAPGCATTRSPTWPCPTRRSTTPRSPSGA